MNLHIRWDVVAFMICRDVHSASFESADSPEIIQYRNRMYDFDVAQELSTDKSLKSTLITNDEFP